MEAVPPATNPGTVVAPTELTSATVVEDAKPIAGKVPSIAAERATAPSSTLVSNATAALFAPRGNIESIDVVANTIVAPPNAAAANVVVAPAPTQIAGVNNPVTVPLTKKQTKKVLRTIQGNFSEVMSTAKLVPVKKPYAKKMAMTQKSRSTTTAPKRNQRYQAGDILQEVTIHYCTALGLIHANVLVKPPLWDQHRLNVGKKEGGDATTPAVSMFPCEKIKVDAVFQGDTMISAAKELDFFDLTTSP